jgi:hypothetical protein
MKTADPDYEPPAIENLEIMFVAFDILYARDQAINEWTLAVRILFVLVA